MRWSVMVGRVAGVPVSVHASVVPGLLVLSGFSFSPVLWAALAGLILLHELGHAVVVRLVGARPKHIVLSGAGGHCEWNGRVSTLQRTLIAWGGVVAQLLVLLVAWLVPWSPQNEWQLTVLSVALTRNAWLVAFNLIPARDLDGVEAWKLPLLLGRRARLRLSSWRSVKVEQSFDADEADPEKTAQANALASQLLADARKPEEPR